MKAIIFARVSSKEQEDGQSIPAQTRRLTEYALKKGFEIDSTYQVTESSIKETRKQFNQIVEYIKKSKHPYALITDTVDRLQRSFRETPQLDDLRRQGKLEIHFLREGLIIDQTSNSAQLLQWDIGVLFASSFIRQLSDNVKRSQEQCIRNGQWTSKAPYGYKNVSLPSGQKTIEIEPEQAAVVSKMYELYALGNHSLQTIAEKIRALGSVKSARGKTVTARTVEVILNNPFYIGIMRIKGKLHRHNYPPLISESLFNKVQELLRGHNKAPVQYAGKPILLRGMIKCKNCEGTVCGDIKKQKYVYYSCHNTKRICVKKWVREEVILNELLTHFDNIQLTDDQISDVIEAIKAYESEAQSSMKKLRTQLEHRLGLARERISKLVDMHVDGKIDAQTYRVKLDEYNREQQLVSAELKSCEEIYTAEHVTAQEVLLLAREAREIFESSKLDEKQQLLNFFFSNLTLDREKLDVELREPFNLMSKHEDHLIWRD